MAVPEPSLSRGRSASGGSDAIDPGVPDHRDPVMTSDTAGSNPGSIGRAPPLSRTIRQRLRGEPNDHYHRAARGQQEAGARLHRPGVQPAQPVKGGRLRHWRRGLARQQPRRYRRAENLAGLLGSFIGALPDLYAAEQDITAENDLVLVRLVVTAPSRAPCWGRRP